ncbi:hypothetical protein [Nocardioides sp. 1609]|uniref:hypothetical protein n=1 Tax=Nocardioides sp. 1609 TaxID=2508327 RepID=UPI0010704469|nr:hypothetical protein [Nocardioides sp. 1609]
MTESNTQHLYGAPQSRRFVHLNRDKIDITRMAPPPALETVTTSTETEYIAALTHAFSTGLLPQLLPDSFGRALARTSVAEPALTITRIRTGIVTDVTDTADIAVVRMRFSPMTILPGEQPRGGAAGGRPTQVREPTAGNEPVADRLGLRVLKFNDTDHLRAWCADALSRSLDRAMKRGRPQEIAATGVRRPVSAAMVLLQFEDGTSSQWAPMLSDGISRLAVCGAALLGQLDVDPVSAAEVIASHLVPASVLTPSSPAHELTRRMRRNHQSFIEQYKRHVDEHGADEDGVRLRQFLTMPADLHLLATDPETGNPHAMEPVMEAVVSDSHTGVDAWDAEDESRHTAFRALKKLAANAAISTELYDLCANRSDPRDTGILRTRLAESHRLPHDENPQVVDRDLDVDHDQLLLRRAVTLMATLLGPSTYSQFKTALRDVSGRQRLTLNQVIDYLSPLVCEPWGTLKPITRAWAYGGPVPPSIGETTLVPLHPPDYLALVAIALNPAEPATAITHARLELALAGGTALIADGVLTTTIVGGSGSALSPLPFRGPVNAAVDALTHTEEGLTALAVAANHFKPGRSLRTARLPAIDMRQPDRVARDGVGIPIRTTETVLANYAAQATNVGTETRGAPPSSAPSTTPEPTPLANLQARARHLPTDTKALLQDVELTKSLHDETGGPTGLNEHELDAVHDSLSSALKLVGRLT